VHPGLNVGMYTPSECAAANLGSYAKSVVAHFKSFKQVSRLSLLLHYAFWRYTEYYTPTNALIAYHILV